MWKQAVAPSIATLLCWLGAAQAHFVWIERDSTEPARVYFGEWADEIREKSGGALDRIKSPRVFLSASQQPLPIERQDDHLAVTVTGPGDIRLLESELAPRADARAGGHARTVYHAKHGRSETVGGLDLELVPVLANGATLVLLFQGAPLPKTTITVYGPPKWEKRLRTDERGQITVPTPWAGRYVLEAVYVDEQPGQADGGTFDRTRHVSTLSFVQQEGMPWPAGR